MSTPVEPEPVQLPKSGRRHAFARIGILILILSLVSSSGSAVVLADDVEVPPRTRTEPTPLPPVEPKPKSGKKCDAFVLPKDTLDFQALDDDAPVRGEDYRDGVEFRLYNDIIGRLKIAKDADLRACARDDLTFRDLVKPVRQDYRFDLVFFKGRLKRLREFKPNKPLEKAGIEKLYECWVFPENAADPMCIVCLDLPEGLTPSKDYTPGKFVTFAGYSFKLMQYESSQVDAKDASKYVRRRAPLILAKTLTLVPVDDDAGKDWREGFIPGILALLGVILAAIVGLTWWFRRGSRHLQRELGSRYDTQNPFTGSGSLPEPAATSENTGNSGTTGNARTSPEPTAGSNDWTA